MSLSEAATEIDYYRLQYSNTYTTPWDANIIFGCVCDIGYDCSRRYGAL